ncbi:MAG: flagellar protein FlaG [Aquificota bacterium]|nr:MAG: flagellar protein FlaG [Aquificota bacterium]
MDIKAVQTQSLTSMNSQNVEIQKANVQKQLSHTVKERKTNQDSLKGISEEELKKIAEELNKKFNMLNSQLKIEIDKDTGIEVAKIIDKETNKVIRQIPPEAILKIIKYLNEVTGLLFNERA